MKEMTELEFQQTKVSVKSLYVNTTKVSYQIDQKNTRLEGLSVSELYTNSMVLSCVLRQ